MPFDLAAIAKRQGLRRSVVIRDIKPPAMLATDLYQACYAPAVAVWSNAVQPIAAEYARSLAEITTDSPADIERQIAAAEQRATSIYLMLDQRLRDWVLRVERWHRGKWRAGVLAATSVDLGTLIGPEAVRTTLEATIATNAALIRNVSDQARQRISQAVFDGLRNRTPAAEVAKRIRESAEMARGRSKRIAADQLAKLTGSLADERRREAGIDAWLWRHGGKLHPRPEHVARDGFAYTDNPKDVGQKVGGKKLREPPADRPSQLPYCSCRSQSYVVI